MSEHDGTKDINNLASVAATGLGSVPCQQKKPGGLEVGIGNFHATLDLRKATIPKNRQHFVSLLWKHKHKTLAYCSVFWSFGMGVSFLGPTILDLGCKTGHVLADVSWIFFIQAFSILLGSAVAGPFIKKFTAEPILVVATITIATTLSIIPFCSGLHVLGTVLAVMGFFMGAIDTTANVSMIKLYGQDVSPFIHALHFCYGLGAFVSPMIAKPFLLNMDCSSFVDNSTESHDLLPENVSLLPANSLADAQDKTRVNYAFWIMSMLQIPVIILVISLFGRQIFMTSKADADPDGSTIQYHDIDAEEGQPKFSNKQIGFKLLVPITFFMVLIVSCYDGLQALYADYIYSYAVDGASSVSNEDAAYLSACFWGFFAFGRLLSVALAMILTPACMLFLNITGCTISTSFMLAGGNDETVIYVGTCVFGLFMSSVFPTTLSLTEQYVNANTIITTILVIGAATGEMCFPVIIGQSFETGGPTYFLKFALLMCFSSYVIYLAAWIVGWLILRKTNAPKSVGVLSICVRKSGTLSDDSDCEEFDSRTALVEK